MRMTTIISAEVLGVRSGTVSFSDYRYFLRIEDPSARIRFAFQNERLRSTLEVFNPFVFKHLCEIVDGKMDSDSKKGRKALRTLTSIIARSATRATPSRISASVGIVKQATYDAEVASVKVGEERILAVKPIVGYSRQLTGDQKLSWNPSAVRFGNRFYLLAPRTETNSINDSVKINPLLDFIRRKTKVAISTGELFSLIKQEFDPESISLVIKAIQELVSREYLLCTDSKGYFTERKNQEVRYFDSHGSLSLDAWLKQYKDWEIESSSEVKVRLPQKELDTLIECYNFLIANGLAGEMDKGLGKFYAEKIHELFGFSKIKLVDLMHPSFGLPYSRIADLYAKTRVTPTPSSSLVKIFTSAILNGDEWIDLSTLELRGEKVLRSPNFSVPVCILKERSGDLVLDVSAGTPSLPSNAIFNRFFSSSVTHHGGESSSTSIDWLSPQRHVNAIRESQDHGTSTLLVNGFPDGERTLSSEDIFIQSDNERIAISDSDGNEIHFLPQSMASIHLFPDWVATLLVAATQGWPNYRWEWGEYANLSDFLPGIRYRNVILSKPSFRYRGERDVVKFNDWADRNRLGEWITLGQMDRKIAVERKSPGAQPALLHLLNSSDSWVEDNWPKELFPVSDKGAQTEVVVGFSVRQEQPMSLVEGMPVSDIQKGQIIPGLSEECNFEITPRGVGIDSLIEQIAKRCSTTFYFIRYRTDLGLPCLRLRIARQSSLQFLDELVRDGFIGQLSEHQHRLELERYGGPIAFSLFENLFRAESTVIGAAAIRGELQAMSVEEKAQIVNAWVLNSPLTTLATPPTNIAGSKASLSVKNFIADLRRLIAPAMVEIPTSSHPSWAAAAHMFCNRLGLSNEQEKEVWKMIGRKND